MCIRDRINTVGRRLFPAKELCELLQLPFSAFGDEDIHVRAGATVDEAGLYTLLLLSPTQEGREFRSWSSRHVHTSIRSSGTFGFADRVTKAVNISRGVHASGDAKKQAKFDKKIEDLEAQLAECKAQLAEAVKEKKAFEKQANALLDEKRRFGR